MTCAVYDHERCQFCRVVGVQGAMPASDPRFSGGFVDASGIRHDPVLHEDGCPVALGLVAGWGEGDG
jgi:hypothetical protein